MAPSLPLPRILPPRTLPLPSLLPPPPPPPPLSPFCPSFTTSRINNSSLVSRHPLAASTSSSSSSCNSASQTLSLHALSCYLPNLDHCTHATHFPSSPQPRCSSTALEFVAGNGQIYHRLLTEALVGLVVIALAVAPFLQPQISAAAEGEANILITSSFLQLTAKEPPNALSLPTWSIHVASVAEWITAMILVWQYGEIEGNESWKGLSWGMVPLLGGAMCACTWHFFYNAESLEALVILQGALTLIGNCTLWIAAFRIYKKVQEKA